MWRVLEPRIESVRRDLASEFGCDPEEMAITRNASEANEIMIFGLDLKRGDEVVITNQNYGRMITVVGAARAPRRDRRSSRSRSRCRRRRTTTSSSSSSPRSRRGRRSSKSPTSRISPARSCRCGEIVDMARPLGIEVFVDGAHAFAHFPFKRDDLGATTTARASTSGCSRRSARAFSTSARTSRRISGRSWPRPRQQDNDIRKYEEIGTHPAANHNAISVALAFHRGIGVDRKIARLRFLRDRWAKTARQGEPAREDSHPARQPAVAARSRSFRSTGWTT